MVVHAPWKCVESLMTYRGPMQVKLVVSLKKEEDLMKGWDVEADDVRKRAEAVSIQLH